MTLDDGRLLFLTSDFPPKTGGMARYSLGLTKSFTRHYEKVFVVVARGRKLEDVGNLDGVEVHQVLVTKNYLRKIF